jgi:A/G-specific adenine glycosylase
MVTGRELDRFRKNLLKWFAQYRRDLPWRRTRDPYRIWLSEIMLQQTRVSAALPYYERFLKRFADVKTLAEAPEEEVLRLWAGLGYYSRARNLQKAARQIVELHDSKFPDAVEEALELAGIGNYTAAAILSIAYGKRLAVLDGNVARVLARLRGIRGDLRNGARWRKLQEIADELLAPRAPGLWNEAMMELGATVCTPRSPQCLLCPVAQFCEARMGGLTDVIPEKRRKRANVEITLAALVLVDARGQTLLWAPPPKRYRKGSGKSEVGALFSRMWHFPTIEVKDEVVKELRRFASKRIFRGRRFSWSVQEMATVRHTVTYRQITVLPFRLEARKLPRASRTKVIALDDLSSIAISNLTRKVARAAMSGKLPVSHCEGMGIGVAPSPSRMSLELINVKAPGADPSPVQGKRRPLQSRDAFGSTR